MINSATTPIGTLTKKISRQDSQCTISPPTVGPSSGPISAGIMTKFIATSSSDFANVRMIARRPTGVIMAAPSPCRIRAATSIGTLTDNPQSTDASVKIATASAKKAARAIAIRNPATDGYPHGQTQDVTGYDRLQTERCHPQTRRHRRNRGIDDGGVELLHEQRGSDDPRQIPLYRQGSGLGCRAVWRRRHWLQMHATCSSRNDREYSRDYVL